jgi:hypothetical protein
LELSGRAKSRWPAEHREQLHFIQPGKPTQNANAASLKANPG